MKDPRSARSLAWLDAWLDERAQRLTSAADKYEALATLHAEAGMPGNAQHLREHAENLRRRATGQERS
jgi:ferritin